MLLEKLQEFNSFSMNLTGPVSVSTLKKPRTIAYSTPAKPIRVERPATERERERARERERGRERELHACIHAYIHAYITYIQTYLYTPLGSPEVSEEAFCEPALQEQTAPDEIDGLSLIFHQVGSFWLLDSG